jgi:hypothetical protein
MQHIFGRVYYPCTPQRKWWQPISGISWLPGIQYAYGKNSISIFVFPGSPALLLKPFVLSHLQTFITYPSPHP